MFKYLSVFACLFLLSCTGSGTKIPEHTDTAPKAKELPVEEQNKDVKIITGSGDALLVELGRPAALLYGIGVETSFSELTAVSKRELPLLLAQIKNHGGVIAGPMSYIYKSIPENGDIRVFIGIPVKSEFKNIELGEFYSIPAGRYFKMLVNAEPGETLKQHQDMQNLLKKQKLSVNLPILEVFGESYNSNMAPVSKATLYYSALPSK